MLRVVIVFGISAVLGFPQTTVDNNANWKILGGQEAADGQFPYQISLQRYDGHHCGGSILNKRWILTAAHCVHGTPSQLTVVVGTNALDAGGVRYAVSEIVKHEKWDLATFANDVALLKVDRDIAFGQKVSTISIAKENVGSGIQTTLSGWGFTSYPGSTPNKLQFIHLKTISFSECNALKPEVIETNICTLTRKGQGFCHGDSGGPLVANGKQVGIVSFAIPCARGGPDVYARVSSYASWIKSKMTF